MLICFLKDIFPVEVKKLLKGKKMKNLFQKIFQNNFFETKRFRRHYHLIAPENSASLTWLQAPSKRVLTSEELNFPRIPENERNSCVPNFASRLPESSTRNSPLDQKFFNKTSKMIKSFSPAVRGETKNEAKPSVQALLRDLRVEQRLRSSNVQVSVEILIASHVAAVDLF